MMKDAWHRKTLSSIKVKYNTSDTVIKLCCFPQAELAINETFVKRDVVLLQVLTLIKMCIYKQICEPPRKWNSNAFLERIPKTYWVIKSNYVSTKLSKALIIIQ